MKNERLVLLPGNFDIRVALGALEADIVFRSVLLDEVAFQGECLQLGVGDDEILFPAYILSQSQAEGQFHTARGGTPLLDWGCSKIGEAHPSMRGILFYREAITRIGGGKDALLSP